MTPYNAPGKSGPVSVSVEASQSKSWNLSLALDLPKCDFKRIRPKPVKLTGPRECLGLQLRRRTSEETASSPHASRRGKAEDESAVHAATASASGRNAQGLMRAILASNSSAAVARSKWFCKSSHHAGRVPK